MGSSSSLLLATAKSEQSGQSARLLRCCCGLLRLSLGPLAWLGVMDLLDVSSCFTLTSRCCCLLNLSAWNILQLIHNTIDSRYLLAGFFREQLVAGIPDLAFQFDNVTLHFDSQVVSVDTRLL